MKEELITIQDQATIAIEKASSVSELEALRVKYLGKKGDLTAILKQMGKQPPEDRPIIGQLANEVRTQIERSLQAVHKQVSDKELNERLENEKIDVTLPGSRRRIGHRHPLSIVLDEVEEIFIGMGFKVAQGPEIETIEFAFDALNIAPDHPARDAQDTFYVNDTTVLRTQTSTVQVRTMRAAKPPIKIISPGRVYRPDTPDATHSPIFNQVEGLVIDKGINFAHLKYTLESFIEKFYKKASVTRFRPHHFPFTEPSAEVDVQCFYCKGKGCHVCKGEGFIELMGCGMVHPEVLRRCGVDPDEYSGFALGMGIERLAMRRFEIDNIRLFYENDVRFLEQF